MQDNRPESTEGLSQAELDRLVAENSKWRERVPKLAAALQARTEELEQLKASTQTAADLTGIRQTLVDEAQSQLQQAKERYQKSEGEMKSREIQIEDLTVEITSWKSKWCELANSLDDRDKKILQMRTQVQEIEDDRASLKTRNEDVVLTAEMAHEEIEVLAREKSQLQTAHTAAEKKLTELHIKLKDQQATFDQVQLEFSDKLKTFEEEETSNEEVRLQLVETKETLAKREQRVEDLDRKTAEQDALLDRLRDSADAGEVRENQLLEEIKDGAEHQQQLLQLEEQVKDLAVEHAHVQKSLALATDKELALSEEVNALAANNQEIQATLRDTQREAGQAAENLNVLNAETDSKAALVMDLEVRLKAKSQQVVTLQEEFEKLSAQNTQSSINLVSDSQQHATEMMLQEKDDHIDELESQQQEVEQKNQRCLVAIEKERDTYARRAEDLESLLLEVESQNNLLTTKLTDVGRINPEDQPRVDQLMMDIRRLEENLRDRTKDINDAEWKSSVEDEKQDQTLVILNQQLENARTENQRLVAKLRATDSSDASDASDALAQPKTPAAQSTQHDDLTQIKGIGPKLASQLNELGVFNVEQIAGLEAIEIEDDHLLHPFKARIYRDDWVGQARQITS